MDENDEHNVLFLINAYLFEEDVYATLYECEHVEFDNDLVEIINPVATGRGATLLEAIDIALQTLEEPQQ